MGIHQRVAQQHTVLLMLEYYLLTQYHTSHTIGGGRYLLTVELADILMPVRTEVVALILMQPEVELCAVLNHRFIE